MTLLLALACSRPCEEECDALADRVVACGGFEASAWRDADDFGAWCDAWSLEQRALARDRGDSAECPPSPESVPCADALGGGWTLASDGAE